MLAEVDLPYQAYLLGRLHSACEQKQLTCPVIVAAVFDERAGVFDLLGYSSTFRLWLGGDDIRSWRRKLGYSLARSDFGTHALRRLHNSNLGDTAALDWYVIHTGYPVPPISSLAIKRLEVSPRSRGRPSLRTAHKVRSKVQRTLYDFLRLLAAKTENLDTYCLVYDKPRITKDVRGAMSQSELRQFREMGNRYPVAFAVFCRRSDCEKLIGLLGPVIRSITPMLCVAAAVANRRFREAVSGAEMVMGEMISHEFTSDARTASELLSDIDRVFGEHADYDELFRQKVKRTSFYLEADLAYFRHVVAFRSRVIDASTLLEDSEMFVPERDLPQFEGHLKSMIREPFEFRLQSKLHVPTEPISIDKFCVWHILRIAIDNAFKVWSDRHDRIENPRLICKFEKEAKQTNNVFLRIEIADNCGGLEGEARNLLANAEASDSKGPGEMTEITYDRAESFWRDRSSMDSQRGLGFLILASYAMLWNGSFKLGEHCGRTGLPGKGIILTIELKMDR